MINFRDLRKASKMTQKQFSEYFGIPKRTIESWDAGDRSCPSYLLDLLEYKLKQEGFIPNETTKQAKEQSFACFV